MMFFFIIMLLFYLTGSVIAFGRSMAVLNGVFTVSYVEGVRKFDVFYICLAYSLVSWLGYAIINILKNKDFKNMKTKKHLEYKIVLPICQ